MKKQKLYRHPEWKPKKKRCVYCNTKRGSQSSYISTYAGMFCDEQCERLWQDKQKEYLITVF